MSRLAAKGDKRAEVLGLLEFHGITVPPVEPIAFRDGDMMVIPVAEADEDRGDLIITPDQPDLEDVADGILSVIVWERTPGMRALPVDAPVPTQQTTATTAVATPPGFQVPYYGRGQAQPTDRPTPTASTRDRFALVDGATIDPLDCGFRMFEPYEVAAAMAFPVGYIPRDLTKTAQVKLAGNAVTPPVTTWIVGRLIRALEAAR